MIRSTLLLLSCFLLCGCATRYREEGYFCSGYSDYRVGQDRFCITFSGNKHTSRERAEQFALLRAAELTEQHGFSHFTVIGSEDNALVKLEKSDWKSEADYPDTWTFATMHSIAEKKGEPRITLRIRCFKDQERKPDSAICAADFISFNAPR